MDGLDLLKKDWNKKPNKEKLSAKDIYPMLKGKSSSIVKMLFYISIAELLFWLSLNFLPLIFSNKHKQELLKIYEDSILFTTLSIISFIIIAVFIYLLFKSYKSISVTDNAKTLMQNILKTRKIVKYYVIYSLCLAGISLIASFYYAVHNDTKTIEAIEALGDKGLTIYLTIVVVFSIIIIVVFWLFYKLIYGFLLKRLNKNYNELKKLES